MGAELGQAYIQIIPSARGIGGKISAALKPEASSAGTMAGNTIGSNLKSALGKAAIGAAVFSVFKKAISEGGKLQQSIGGIETLFKNSAGTVEKYASNAFQTAGLSANDYMENVTSFAASLIGSLGGNTAKAAEQANVAMTDMSDNANKMGTSMSAIQWAYQGFAKQNYTMLDNLKLGYGGTKSEMQRLLQDAQKLTGQKYDITNLSDVYSAIHAIQVQLGITGTTAKEASSTLTGSFAMMSAAWSNLLADMALGNDAAVQTDLINLSSSLLTFAGNLIPMIINIIAQGLKSLPVVAKMAFDGMMNAASAILSGTGSTKIITAIINWLPKIILAILQIAAGVLNVLGSVILKLIMIGYQALNNFVLGIFSGSGKLVSTGLTTINKFITGLLSGAGRLLSAAGIIVIKFVGGILKFGAKIIATGLGLTVKLVSGILRGIGRATSAANRIISAILTGLKRGISKVISIGLNIVKGIWNGISSGLGWLKSKLSGWIGNVTSFIKKLFKIGSPSKLMAEEVGQWIPKGIAMGIIANTGAVTDAMTEIANETALPFGNDFIHAASVTTNGIATTSSGVSSQANVIDYDKIADAVLSGVEGMAVEIDKRKFGKLVRKGAANAI